jgi:excisionase family DNA binding protein
MYTVKEIAEMFRVHVATIYRLAERGELRHIRVGDTIRIPPEAVEEFRRRATRPARVEADDQAN